MNPFEIPTVDEQENIIEYPYKMTDEQKEKYQDLLDSNEQNAVNAYIEICGKNCIDDALENFEKAYQGNFPSDEEFARETAESEGELPRDNHWPHYCIDWEYAARELMMDYSEEDGYYFRNL